MRTILPVLFCAALAGTLAAQTPAAPAKPTPPKTHLKVGDMAPDFTLSSSQKKPIKLSDFRGKQGVVLAFFPAAFTGG
jgi:cytochrome oxidase Cu insertion factor (SCO1/SenC/PrrC family)